MAQQGQYYDDKASQVYQVKQNKDAAASQWQVDTQGIRQHLELKLKGKGKVRVTYRKYKLLKHEFDRETEEWVEKEQFWAENDAQAREQIKTYCKQRDLDPKVFKAKPTGEEETKPEIRPVKKPLLPDEACDQILTPIETTFSQVGYLTKYNERDIKDEIYNNASAIRMRLYEMYHEREDVDPSNFELIINLVKNMMKQVLKAAKGGFTAKGLRERTQERIITNTDEKKKLRSLS